MQKKLIALAVAGLASTAAFAQTNVTIYGLVDYGYAYRWDGRDAGTVFNNAGVPIARTSGTPNSQSQLNGGQSLGNRLGFKGTEDLGNGLKAVFLLEQGFMLDTGNQQTAGSQFTRQAYMGLSGNFGTVVGGRLYTPHYTFVSGLDPFGAGTVGRYNNVYSSAAFASYGNGGTLGDPVRVDNAVAYISPSFLGGLTATLAFSNNAGGQEDASSNAANNTVYAGLLKYDNGPISAGLNYHYINGGSRLSDATLASPIGVKNAENATLGGSYDFKVVKVMALYSWNQVDYLINPALVSNTGRTATINNYMLGATAPFGKFVGKASYIYSDGNTRAGGDAQQFALGLDYNLSKRTAIYSAYSFIDNSDNRMSAVGDASNSGAYAAGNGYNLPGVFQQGIQFGVRHMF
ncbi:MAG TPA: porin [Azonexus sp.]|nr:porin [Azonexus sp.]